MEDGGGECGREAKVAPPTATSNCKVQIPDEEDFEFDEMEVLENYYEYSEGVPWREFPEINGEARYSSFYRDQLTETVKSEFFMAPVKNLHSFCRRHDPDAPCLRDMLSDAVMFFKLHNTWQVYICPSCDCLPCFPSQDSLVLHLMYKHHHAFPFLPQNPTKDQSCSAAPPTTMWKPIHLTAALDKLSTIYCSLDTNPLGSVEWPLSNDSPRSILLARLLTGFDMLLDSREGESFTVRSAACLQALIVVASQHILRHLDPTNILPLPIITLLYRSPLSFLFMEVHALEHFVLLVEEMCESTLASQNRKLQRGEVEDVNCSKSECPDAVSFSVERDCFFLHAAELNCPGADEKDMGSWLFQAPYFPKIQKLPTKTSEVILQLAEKAVLFYECLRTVHAQSDLKLLTSCLKILNMEQWLMPLLDTESPESASSNAANVKDMLSPSCHIFREPSKRQRTEFGFQVYLELIGLAWELHVFELQVRRLCAVDLRDHFLLPLLKSFFRMKLLLSVGIESVFEPGGVKEEDAGEGNNMIEGSRDEHPAEHVFSRVDGKPGAGDDSIMMTPEMSSYKRSEEVSITPAELGSCSTRAVGVSDVDPMMIDSPRAGCIGNSADTALSLNRIGIAAAIAESEVNSEAMPESDAEHESKAEMESQQSGAIRRLCCVFDTYPDSDRLYEPEVRIKDVDAEMREFMMAFPDLNFFGTKHFSTVVWLGREECAWQRKKDGLFVCMTINAVMKHCLVNKLGLETAQNIYGWKTSRSSKYWCCFACKKRFPDQKSHKLHLGLSWGNDWSVPIQVQQEGQSGVNEDVKERGDCLDDSITVDCTYRRFIVEMGKFESSYQNEEEGCIENISELEKSFRHKLEEISRLEDMCAKSKLCLPYEFGEDDAEIVPYVAKSKFRMNLEQCLSNFCVSDYKNDILPSIRSFMQGYKDMFSSRALQRLEELLRGVRCPYLGLPGTYSIEPVSLGKVIINIEEYDGGITFAYHGIHLAFSADVPFKEPMRIKGICMFSGISDSDVIFYSDGKVILDEEIKITEKMFNFREDLGSSLRRNLEGKLREFQAEMRRELHKGL